MADQNPALRVPVVGIGASAGGISALRDFFKALPEKTGAAFAIIIHLDPDHQSQLANVLAACTPMPVAQVEGRMTIVENSVFVIPPNARLLITGNEITTAPFEEPRGRRAPIDQFFCSLADEHGDGFAIVLSGSGSDGAVGVRAVKEKGGLILVQDPNEAEYPMMPRNALPSADIVAPIKDLADNLVELLQAKAKVSAAALGDSNEDQIRAVLAYLRERTSQDFSQYKRSTVMRRLARRMQVVRVVSVSEYLSYLRSTAAEVQALFNDLLISVTSFFRDAEAYASLLREAIAPLIQARDADEPIRIWVPGCATGEEAYSIAILLLEEAAHHDVRPQIQIFATDLDTHALAIAREGVYPAAITADVNEERQRRFFTSEGRPMGFLFLGTSESADYPEGLFLSINRDARLYRASDHRRHSLPPLPRVLTALRIPAMPAARRLEKLASVDARLHRKTLEEMSPPSILVDSNHQIVNLSETAGRYVQPPSGPLSSDVAEIVRPELRLELRAALHRALQHNQRSLSRPIPVQFNGTPQAVAIQVRPVGVAGDQRAALVVFLEGGPVEVPTEAVSPANETTAATQLHEDLTATRNLLRTSREQHESATEELRASNEELQSINEEYRATAEELETSKEELQSINEELQTLNNELKLKLDQVSRAHNDLQNLMTATDFATLFLDAALRIKRFTPRTSDLFSIAPGDEGRPVTDFTHRLDYQKLVSDAQQVLADFAPLERTVRSLDDRWYMMRIRPYRTLDDRIEGIVLTFIDVTERRQADAAWANRQKVLLDELSHRVNNSLAVVQAIVSHTLANSGIRPDAALALQERIHALAKSHSLLVNNQWKGASLEALAREQLATYASRLSISGPSVLLPPALATPMGMILHELATNAAKHGSLSTEAGTVELAWRTVALEGGGIGVRLDWREQGGPPPTEPQRQGFGSSLIDRCIHGLTIVRDWRPEGLVVALELPLLPLAMAPA